MRIRENKKYLNEISLFSNSLDLSFFDNKSILISGACGLVMSYFIDTLLAHKDLNCRIFAIIYSDTDKERFSSCDKRLNFLYGDVTDLNVFKGFNEKVDIIISGASIVDPKGYKEKPIETMTINILGTKNLLDIASRNNAVFLLISSCEVYGISGEDSLSEESYGIVDPLDVRSCYNESKRASETLAVSYATEKGIKCLIARLSRTFGPTQSPKDTKALSQFMRNAILGENIVLKSDGEQIFSYTYVQDIVRGLLVILTKGSNMNAYNVCNRETLRLKEIAEICSSYKNEKVSFDLSDDGLNKAGYSKTRFAIQDPSKLEELGFKAVVPLKDAILNTIEILDELYYR